MSAEKICRTSAAVSTGVRDDDNLDSVSELDAVDELIHEEFGVESGHGVG